MLLRAAVVGSGDVITGADLRTVLAVPREETTLEDRLRNVLAHSGAVSMGQITAALRVPRTTAWRAISALSAAGLVRITGTGKGRRYSVAIGQPPSLRTDCQRVADLARDAGIVTRRSVVRSLGISERTAGRLLAEMVVSGCLRAVGGGRAAAYIPVPDERPSE